MAKRISQEQQSSIDEEIKRNEKFYDYRTVQWEIQHICNIFGDRTDNEDDFSEGTLFVPTYQRDYVRPEKLKVKFIESLFLNIPIPYIFINEDYQSSDMEIIDGYQRIRTMYEFINNKLKLKSLDKLQSLNNLKFSDLSSMRQNLFKRKVCNIVIFTNLEIEQKKEMFSRINTTAEGLKSIELRKGIIGGPFYQFLKELSESPLMKELAPLSSGKAKREEGVELVLRFFAYTDKFNDYKDEVDVFLTDYLKTKTNEISDIQKEKITLEGKQILLRMKEEFFNMMNFVKLYFKYGFRKTGKDKVVVSRTYFESIAVGVGLALREKSIQELDTLIIEKLLNDPIFKKIVASDGANASKKFKARINAMKNALLLSELPKAEWKE